MMNRILSLALLLFVTSIAYAQIEKGAFLLGGEFRLSTEQIDAGSAFVGNNSFFSGEDITAFSFRISPRLGYFLSDHWAAGLLLDYQYGRAEGETFTSFLPNAGREPSELETNMLSAGAFVRYYNAFREEGKLGFWMEAGGLYGAGSFERRVGEEDDLISLVTVGDTEMFRASFTPGLYYLPHPSIAFEAALGSISYVQTTEEGGNAPNGGPVTSSRFTTSFSDRLGFQLGLTFFLNRGSGQDEAPQPGN